MLLFLLRVFLGLSFLAIVRGSPRLRAFSVDDTSTLVQYRYKSEWITAADQPDEMGLFNNTETSSNIQGAVARIVFTGMFTLCVRI
jgi:hypothetical protein